MRAPTPTDMDMAPELSILAALETTGELARTAIISARAELRDPESGQRFFFSEDGTGTVKTLMTLIDALLEQLENYRDMIDSEHRRADLGRPDDF